MSQLVIVTGCMRSKTSITTGLLSNLGVNLGTVGGTNAWNPTGDFQNPDFMNFHHTLQALQGVYLPHQAVILSPAWITQLLYQGIGDEATALISTINSTPFYGFKSPHAGIFAPLWDSIDPNIKYIVCLRNPLDCAQSMGDNFGISKLKALGLWHYLNEMYYWNIDKSKMIYVKAEDLVNNTMETISNILNFIGITFPANLTSICSSMVIPAANHYSHTLSDIEADTSVPSNTLQLYQSLASGHQVTGLYGTDCYSTARYFRENILQGGW